jgi:hypothetical protein
MATAKYDQENTVRINLKLNRNTDAEIIEKLRAVPSMQGYIRKLIKNDIEGEKKMKKSEIIEKYAQEIIEAMVERYRKVLECDGRIQYKLYIWDNGEIEYLEGAQGDSSWLQPNEGEKRTLYYICTISQPGFDWAEALDHPVPEDEEEREEERAAVIDWEADQYEQAAPDTLDEIIAEAAREEKYDEGTMPPFRG